MCQENRIFPLVSLTMDKLWLNDVILHHVNGKMILKYVNL